MSTTTRPERQLAGTATRWKLFWAFVMATLVASVLTQAPVAAGASDQLATPVVSSASLFQDTITFAWGAVPDRAEYHYAVIYPDGGVVRGATTNTSHVIKVDGQVGDHCMEVRAVLGGRDSALSERKCAVTPTRWPRPEWIGGMSLSNGLAHANFNVVPGTINYQAQFRLDGTVIKTERLTTMSFRAATISTETDGRTGEWCSRARALVNGDIGSSRWTTWECKNDAPVRMATPTLNSHVFRLTPATNPTHAYLYWANDAAASSYQIQWYQNGTRIATTTRPATARSAGRSLSGLSGNICARVRALSTTQQISPWTRQECLTHNPKLATPIVSTSEVDGNNVVFSWGSVPERAEYHWAVIEPEGRTVRGATTATTHSVAHNGQPGSWCIEVIAVLASRDSSVSERECATVSVPEAPLPTPAPTAPGAPGDWVSTNWPAIDGAASYSIRWYRNGSIVSQPTRTQRYASIAVGTGGRICVSVRANGSTSASNSTWSGQRCITFHTLATPSPSAPAADGTTLFSEWPSVPNAIGYETLWTRDGETLSDNAVSSTRSARFRLPTDYGEFCFTVNAMGNNNYANSAKRTTCTTFVAEVQPVDPTPPVPADPPLATPTLRAPAYNASSERMTYSWGPVSNADSYLVHIDRTGAPDLNALVYGTSIEVDAPSSVTRVCVRVSATSAIRIDSPQSGSRCLNRPADPITPTPAPLPYDNEPPRWNWDAALRIHDHTVVNPSTWGIDLAWYEQFDRLDLRHFWEGDGQGGLGQVAGFEIFVDNMTTPNRTVPEVAGQHEVVPIRGLSYGVPHTVGVRIVDSAGNKSEILTAELREPDRGIEPVIESISSTGTPQVVPNPNPTPIPQEPAFEPAVFLYEPPAPIWPCTATSWEQKKYSDKVVVSWTGGVQNAAYYTGEAFEDGSLRKIGNDSQSYTPELSMLGLAPGSSYVVLVRAYGSGGADLGTCSVGVETLAGGAPATPWCSITVAPGTDSAQFAWSEGPEGTASTDVALYQVNRPTRPVTVRDENNRASVGGLVPDSRYSVMVVHRDSTRRALAACDRSFRTSHSVIDGNCVRTSARSEVYRVATGVRGVQPEVLVTGVLCLELSGNGAYTVCLNENSGSYRQRWSQLRVTYSTATGAARSPINTEFTNQLAHINHCVTVPGEVRSVHLWACQHNPYANPEYVACSDNPKIVMIEDFDPPQTTEVAPLPWGVEVPAAPEEVGEPA